MALKKTSSKEGARGRRDASPEQPVMWFGIGTGWPSGGRGVLHFHLQSEPNITGNTKKESLGVLGSLFITQLPLMGCLPCYLQVSVGVI